MDNNQKLAFTLGITIAAIMLCSGTAFISYTYGQHIGYNTGFEANKEVTLNQVEVQEQSRESEYQAGYQAGQQAGCDRYNAGKHGQVEEDEVNNKANDCCW